jgi:N utilization substance protein B
MSARGKARKRALDVLFAAEMRGVDPVSALAQQSPGAGPAGPGNPYTATLVRGVVAHQAQIDDLLNTYSMGWPLDRMPAVDRNVLRIGVFELLWSQDVPPVVAINEAVSLVTLLSTDESPAFVNGLLARILQLRDTLVVRD